MQHRNTVSLQSLLSIVVHSDLNHLGTLQANKTLGQAGVGAEINLATGKLIVKDCPLSFSDLSGNIEFGYVYTGQSQEHPWQLLASKAIKQIDTEQQIIVLNPDGSEHVYQYRNNQYEFRNIEGLATIRYDAINQRYVWYHAGKRLTEYFSIGENRVWRSIDAKGLTTEYQYKDSKLSAILTPSGISYRISYSENEVVVYRKTALDEQIVHRYHLGQNHILADNAANDVYLTHYEYQDRTNLVAIKQSDKSEFHFNYYAEGKDQFKLQEICLGDRPADAIKLEYQGNTTTLKLPSGESMQLTYNDQQQIIHSNLCGQNFNYQYTVAGQLEKIAYVDGSEEKFEYHPVTGLLTKHTKRDGNYETFEYAEDAEPVLIRHTQYKADSNAPQLMSRYVYASNRINGRRQLCYEISQRGTVREYKHNEQGLIVTIRDYLTNHCNIDCQAPVPSYEDMQTWKTELDKNAQPPEIQYTLFEYEQDAQVKRKSEFSALLPNGQGDRSKPFKETEYQHDANGNVLLNATRTTMQGFLAVRREFDSLNRLHKIIEACDTPLMRTTEQDYSDNQTRIMHANRQSELTTLNAAGLIATQKKELSEPNKELLETKIERKPECKMNVITHSDSTQEYEFFDATDRVVGRIGKSGQVTKTEFFEQGRYRKDTAFAKKIILKSVDLSGDWLMIADSVDLSKGWVEPESDNEDRETYTFYGFNNEIRFEVDAEGYLKEYRYHLNHETAHIINYELPVTPDELAQLKRGLFLNREPNRNVDRIHSSFYDEDGRLSAEQDGAGYITEYERDAGGRQVKKTLYANPLSDFTDDYQHIKLALKKDQEHDSVHYYFYNSLNQLVMEIDNLNVITREFDLDGKTKQETRHYQPIQQNDWIDKTIRPIVKPCNKDQTSTFAYDELRRLQSIRTSNDEVRLFSYDEMDNQISATRLDALSNGKSDGDHYRGKLTRYNALGQVTAALNEFAVKILQEIDNSLSNEERKAKVEEIWSRYAEKYEYNIHGLKVKTTDALGKVTFHYYDNDRNLAINIDPTGAVIEKNYNAFGEQDEEVHCLQRISKENLTTLEGGFINGAIRQLYSQDWKVDKVTKMPRDKRGLIHCLAESPTRFKTFKYNAFKQIKRETQANDNNTMIVTEHEYDGRGLEINTTKSAEGETAIITANEYKHPLGLKTAEVDACGDRREFVRGQAGQIRQEKRMNENNEMIVVKTSQYDAFSRLTDQTNADNQSIHIDYNENERSETTLLADGVSKQRIFKNVFNEIIRTQTISAENKIIFDSSTEHAPDGQICRFTDGVGNVTQHDLNMLGLEEKTLLPNKSAIKYEYNDAHVRNNIITDAGDSPDNLNLSNRYEIDALQRQAVIYDAFDHATVFDYTPQGECQKTTRDMGDNRPALITKNEIDTIGDVKGVTQGDAAIEDQLIVKKLRDGFGRVRSEITAPDKLNITKLYQHDQADRVTKFVDPEGYITRSFYNRLGQLRYELKPVTKSLCCLVERQYSPAGKLIERRVHRSTIPEGSITDATSLSDIKRDFQGEKHDQITRYYYDHNGHIKFKVKLTYDDTKQSYQAVVTEKAFDAVGQQTKRHKYANYLMLATVETLTADKLIELTKAIKDPASDEIRYRYYNTASQCRYEIDQDGYVTEKIYNELGKVITVKQFEHPVANPEKFQAETFQPAGQCRCKHAIYDAVGREIFSIAANGQLIKKDYDKNGNLLRLCRFKDVIDTSLSYAELVNAAKQRVPDSTKDSIVQRSYDFANRMETATDEINCVDIYKLNAMGSIELHIDRNGQEHRNDFDEAQRKIREWSPETTFAVVTENNGQLTYKSDHKSIAKKFDRDQNGNATKITQGENLGELVARSVELDYTAAGTVLGTTVRKVDVANDDFALQADGVESKDITTRVVLNEQGLKIAECNEDSHWNYYIRDAFGRILYTIINEQLLISHQYNALGLETKSRQYQNPFASNDWTLFRDPTKVLTAMAIASSHQEHENDRIIESAYHPSGKLKSQQTSKLAYYSDGKFGEAQPITNMQYNRFGELVYEAKLLSPGKWAEKAIWRDAAGRTVLEIDENRYVTHYIRDAFGRVERQIEYSNPLAESIKFNLKELFQQPLADLLQVIEKSHKLDRIYVNEYDRRGDKVSEKLLDVKASSLNVDNKNIPSLIKIMRESVGKRYIMSKTQKCLQVLLETDIEAERIVLEENVYDERDLKIATLGQARTRKNPSENAEIIVPLTKTLPNAFGETAVKQTSPKSCIKDKDSKPNFAQGTEIIEEIVLHDKRGKSAAQQNGAGAITRSTFTASGKVSAKTVQNKTYEKMGGVVLEPPSKIIKTTEKVKYHPSGEIVEQYQLAGGKTEQALLTEVNHFGEIMGCRNSNLPSAEFKKRDASGRVWQDNGDEGATKIRLRDLQGHLTGILSADDIDLKTKTMQDVPELLQADRKKVLLEQFRRDNKGALLDYRAASSYRFTNSALPTYSQLSDRWNNHISKTDSRGYTTTLKADKRDNITTEIKPETSVRKADGKAARLRPKTKYGFNTGNGMIGKIDPRGYCEAYRLDEANQLIERILADGVLDKRFVYDALGRIEIAFNSKQGRFFYKYDPNSDVIELNLPEGGTFKYRYDQRRNRIYIQSPSGSEHRMNHSLAGDVIDHYSHLGELTKMVYNHRHQLMAEANPDGTTRSWALDYFGLADNHQDMSGRITTFQRNFNRKVVTATTSNSPALPEELLHQGYIPSGPYAPKPSMELVQAPATRLESEIHNTYEYGQLTVIDDVTGNKIEKHSFDSDLRPESFTIIERHSGQILRHVTQTHNELGLKDHITDQNNLCNGSLTTVNIDYVRDEDANVVARVVAAEHPRYHPACAPIKVDRGEWTNAIDPVGRATVVNGAWYGNVVKHATQRGFTLDFDPTDGTRIRERYDASATTHRDAWIHRDREMRIYTINMNNGMDEARLYTPGSILQRHQVNSNGIYQEGTKNRYNTGILRADANEKPLTLTIFDSQLAKHMTPEKIFPENPNSEKMKKWSTTEYNNTPSGIPSTIKTTFNYDHLTTVELKTETYVGKESLEESAVNVHVKNKHGENTGKANFAFNHNLDAVGKPGWDEERLGDGFAQALFDMLSDKKLYIDRTSDGKVLNKFMFLTTLYPHKTILAAALAPILDVNGNVEGVYRAPFNLQSASLDYQHHAGANNAPEQDIQVPAHIPFSAFVEQESLFDFPDAIKSNIENQFQTASAVLVPKVIRVLPGDTLESIARTYFGHPRYAEDIAMRNGLLGVANRKLVTGGILYMPHISPDRLKEDAAMPYYLFASKVVGRLSPHVGIPLPKIHHPNFFGQFVKLIAVALVVVYAPVLANAAFMALGGAAALTGASLAAASAVVAGIGDAAIQGLAVGLGVQEKFSTAEVLETAITAGMASPGGKSLLNLGASLDIGTQAMNAVKIASIQVATQLAEMGIGAREKFDARSIGEQVLGSLVSSQISNRMQNPDLNTQTFGTKAAIQVATTTTNAVIGSMVNHTPLNVHQMVTQSISGLMQNELDEHLNRQMENSSFVNDSKPELIKISDPTFVLPKPAYGEVSYAMGVLNQARMANENVKISKPANVATQAQKPSRVTASVSANAKVTHDGFYDYVDAFNNGMAASTMKIADAISSIPSAIWNWKTTIPKIANELGNVGLTVWDGYNAIGDAAFGLSTDAARARNLIRGSSVNKSIDHFVAADGVTRTRMLTELGGDIYFSAVTMELAPITLTMVTKATTASAAKLRFFGNKSLEVTKYTQTETTKLAINPMSPENISASDLASFSNKYFTNVKPGIYYQVQRFNQKDLGQYFSPMKALSSLEAEELFNIKAWGNNADQVVIIKIKPGLEAWQGRVQGGSGEQLFIPKALHEKYITTVDVEPLFTEELKRLYRT